MAYDAFPAHMDNAQLISAQRSSKHCLIGRSIGGITEAPIRLVFEVSRSKP